MKSVQVGDGLNCPYKFDTFSSIEAVTKAPSVWYRTTKNVLLELRFRDEVDEGRWLRFKVVGQHHSVSIETKRVLESVSRQPFGDDIPAYVQVE